MNPLRLLKDKFWRDSVTLQIGSMINSAGNLLSAVALAHVLGAHEQGQFYVAIALYSLWFLLLNQGLSAATVAQVAAANARGIRFKVAAWLAFLCKGYLLLALIVIAVGYLVLPLLGALFRASPQTSQWAFWLSFTPIVELPRIVVCAAFQGTRSMKALAQTENTHESARAFLVIAGALMTNSPVGAIVGTLCASAIGSIVAIEVYIVQQRLPNSPLPSVREILAQVRDVPLSAGLRMGVKLGLLRSIDALGLQVLPTLFMERWGASAWVAYLRIARTFMTVPLMFMQGVSRTVMPVMSELAGLKDMDRFRQFFVRASVYSGLIISSGILLSLVVLPFALEWLFPPSYREPVWTMCLILVPGFVAQSFCIANDVFYLVTNTLRVGVYLSIALFVFCMPLIAFLAWKIPTTGVAIGMSFSFATAATNFIFIAYYFRKQKLEKSPSPAPLS
ncbi:MAG: lipopolysaccharide biosynthesis protein [Planctomycetota bacterium]